MRPEGMKEGTAGLVSGFPEEVGRGRELKGRAARFDYWHRLVCVFVIVKSSYM